MIRAREKKRRVANVDAKFRSTYRLSSRDDVEKNLGNMCKLLSCRPPVFEGGDTREGKTTERPDVQGKEMAIRYG